MRKYQLIACPECGKREAYVYLDDIKKSHEFKRDTVRVYCNRRNKCGFSGFVLISEIGEEFTTVEKVSKRIKKVDKEKAMSARAVQAVHLLSQSGKDFPFESFRGISREVFEKTSVSYFEDGWVGRITSDKIENGSNFVKLLPGDFGTFYSKDSFNRRNLLFWVGDYQGDVRRVLMRSTENVFPKELQAVIPGFDGKVEMLTIWNIESVINNPEIEAVMAVEGVYDAMSLIEAVNDYKNISAVALAGVAQVNKLKDLLDYANNKRVELYGESVKKIKLYIMFDTDVAGDKYAKRMTELYPDSERIPPVGVDSKGNGLDFNDMLQEDKNGLTNYLKSKIKEL